jgi:hypothetical protein
LAAPFKDGNNLYDVLFRELECLEWGLCSALGEIVKVRRVLMGFMRRLRYLDPLSEELIFLLDCIIILPHYIKIIRSNGVEIDIYQLFKIALQNLIAFQRKLGFY